MDEAGTELSSNQYDITEMTVPMLIADGIDGLHKTNPMELYGTKEHPDGQYTPANNKFTVECYYDQSLQTDAAAIIGDGTPIKVGNYDIYVGLKGDIKLDNTVNETDAVTVLQFYAQVGVLEMEYYELDPDEALQELEFYLGDVCSPIGMQPNSEGYSKPALYEYYYNLVETDAVAILSYYARVGVLEYPAGHDEWVRAAGFDFPDGYDAELLTR